MYPLLRGRALHPEQEVVLCLRSGRRRDRSSHRLPYHQRLPCRAWRRPVHYSRPCRPRTRTIKPLRREKTGQEGDKTSIIFSGWARCPILIKVKTFSSAYLIAQAFDAALRVHLTEIGRAHV